MKSNLSLHGRTTLVAFLLTFSLSFSYSQKKEYTLLEYLERAATSDTPLKLDYTNTLILDGVDAAEKMREKGYEVDANNRVIISKPVFIKNVKIAGASFELNGVEEQYDHMFLAGFSFRSSFELSLSGLSNFEVSNCAFYGGYEIRAENEGRIMVDFTDNEIYASGIFRIVNGVVVMRGNYFQFDPDGAARTTLATYYNIKREVFTKIVDSLRVSYTNIMSPLDAFENTKIICVACESFTLDETGIDSEVPNYVMFLDIRSESLSFINNQGNASFQFTGTVQSNLRVDNNKVNGFFLFKSFNYPENALIQWSDLDGKVAIPSSMFAREVYPSPADTVLIDVPTIYTGKNANDNVLDKADFNQLLFTFKQIHSTYVKRGNLEDANNCFVAIKDLEAEKLEARQLNDPSFRNWIRWKLNRLMKLYTNHGTDPGLAIQISIYLILFFSAIYFFFPSDWDTKPKAELWEKMRSLRHQKGKSLFKSTASWIYLLFLMMLNAFTLSLNVFVTLGFGNIPTHGIARHICIVQGFLGWFLLSLFSVALINQILF